MNMDFNNGHAQYDVKQRFKNTHTDNEFRINAIGFDEQLWDIVYHMSHYRYKFDVFKIPESTLVSNLESGDYVIRGENGYETDK